MSTGSRSAPVTVASSPQFFDSAHTRRIMWTVSAVLTPAAAWGVYVFGIHAFFVLFASIIAAVIGEGVMARILNRRTLRDGSAVLTGLMVGMTMPPAVPVYIPVVASLFAIIVVKWTFGGLGSNWMNPALAGRVFVYFSWTPAMTGWTMPSTLPQADAVSGASMLGLIKQGLSGTGGHVGSPLRFLRDAGFPVSTTDTAVTDWLNQHVLHALGFSIPGGYVDPFLGNIPGSIGEVSAALLLLGTVVLLARRIITWEIPASYFLSFALLTWVFGGARYGTGLFGGDILFQLFTGGFILGAFYMATDTVTTPLTSAGMLIYGGGAGILTFLIRFYGAVPEGVALAIILMNVFTPLINRYTRPGRYGLSEGRR